MKYKNNKIIAVWSNSYYNATTHKVETNHPVQISTFWRFTAGTVGNTLFRADA